MQLSEQEMMRLWLLRKGYEPLRSDCQIERSDGADLQAIARGECRLWYERLLAEAPAEMLVLHDLSQSSDIKISITNRQAIQVTLPKDCIRPIAVKLVSWYAPAKIVKADSPLAARQYADYGCGGIVHPVAIWHPDNRLELFSPSYEDADSDILQYLRCVVRTFEDDNETPIYEFQPLALSSL